MLHQLNALGCGTRALASRCRPPLKNRDAIVTVFAEEYSAWFAVFGRAHKHSHTAETPTRHSTARTPVAVVFHCHSMLGAVPHTPAMIRAPQLSRRFRDRMHAVHARD